METTVYADLLFLVNAGMDCLCLCMTARLLHRRLRIWRLLTGTVLGGIYAVVALLLPFGEAASLAADVAVCFVMCALTFGLREGHGWRGLIGATGLYTALSMLMGGVMTALFNLFNRAGVTEWRPSGGEGLGAWLFLVCSVVGSMVSMRGGRLWRRSGKIHLCDVKIEVAKQSVTLRGFVDSGNLLRDPAGGRAVICIGEKSAKKLLSSNLFAVMASGGTDVSRLRDPADIRRLRLIPAGTATGQDVLPAFRPDKITLTPDGEKSREVDAVIAVTKQSPRGGVAGEAEALVPLELI